MTKTPVTGEVSLSSEDSTTRAGICGDVWLSHVGCASCMMCLTVSLDHPCTEQPIPVYSEPCCTSPFGDQ